MAALTWSRGMLVSSATLESCTVPCVCTMLRMRFSFSTSANWVVSGSARWDLEANKINQYLVGAGYVDDCFVLAANYVTSYTYTAGTTPPVLSHAFMLQIGLRTIATSSTATSAAGIQ